MLTNRVVRRVMSTATSFLAIGAVMLIGKADDAKAADGAPFPNAIEEGDIEMGYVIVGDVDSDGGGNPPFPE